MIPEIIALSSEKEHKAFIDFPHDLYKGDRYYVPEIYIGQKELLSKKKNPFFKNAEVALFIAKAEGKIVGRIAAIDNKNYNNYHKSNVGFFGLFDSIHDQEVANTLLDTAKAWLQKRNFDVMLGPTNFSTNDTAGLLVEGFDMPPLIMMTYNKAYYVELLENYGFKKDMDLFAYKIPTKHVSEKSIRIANLLSERLERKGVRVRQLNMKNFDTEVNGVREIYNSAWADNWGFVPATKDEFNHLAEGLKMVVNPKYTFIAETDDGKMVGFMLAVPNINEIVINMPKGRLLPFGIFKLLMGKNKTKAVRIITMGVIEEYRKLGIEGIFYAKIIQAAKDNNIDFGEASWILENNEMMNQAAKKLNGEIYKVYRIYNYKLK